MPGIIKQDSPTPNFNCTKPLRVTGLKFEGAIAIDPEGVKAAVNFSDLVTFI